jgi:hypothetical protein
MSVGWLSCTPVVIAQHLSMLQIVLLLYLLCEDTAR